MNSDKRVNEGRRFRATANDWYNYSARYGMSNYTTQTVIRFNGVLNTELIDHAFRKCAETEPLVGCCFTDDPDSPYWEEHSDLDSVSWFELEETFHEDEAVNKFLALQMDMDRDPLVTGRIIRCNEKDTLCLKFNHALFDGASIKSYLKTFVNACSGEEISENKKLLNNNLFFGSLDSLFRAMDLENEEAHHADSQSPAHGPSFPFRKNITGSKFRYQRRCFTLAESRAIHDFAGRMNCTVNDVLLTAFVRAMKRINNLDENKPQTVVFTVDMRRYLTGCSDIGNLSMVEDLVVSSAGKTFEQDLKIIISLTGSIKKGKPGLGTALACRYMELGGYSESVGFLRNMWEMIRSSGVCSPILSNGGIIDSDSLKIAGLLPEDSFIVPPAYHSPGFMTGVCTCQDRLNMVVSFYEEEINADDVRIFLDMMENDLKNLSVWLNP